MWAGIPHDYGILTEERDKDKEGRKYQANKEMVGYFLPAERKSSG